VSNLRQYLNSQRQTRVLLSIKPQYAEAIMLGEKRFEFRRNIFSRQVDIITIYVTAPISKVVAEFDVLSIITESLPSLWQRTRKFAGINEAVFYQYFHGLNCGNAISIGEVRKYDAPFCPLERLKLRPPQSFAYIDSSFDVDRVISYRR